MEATESCSFVSRNYSLVGNSPDWTSLSFIRGKHEKSNSDQHKNLDTWTSGVLLRIISLFFLILNEFIS